MDLKHPPVQQAPRPIALHLAIQNLTFMSSIVALSSLSSGLPHWNGPLKEKAERLARALAGFDQDEVRAAVETEIRRRLTAFGEGVRAYETVPRPKPLKPLPVVWSEGTTDVHHAAAEGLPVILVPSLINRARILDLQSDRSMVRYLSRKGHDTYLVDWDGPGDQERTFTVEQYVARLERIVSWVQDRTGRRPAVVGYCMGGLLALALAHRRPGDIAALALLATPWDFGAMRASATAALRSSLPVLDATIKMFGVLPVDVLQGMFASLDPGGSVRKFRAFAGVDPNSASARAFVALEDWLSDGVPLSGPVAHECLRNWYCDNEPFRGAWLCGDTPVCPQNIKIPSLLVVPSDDRIVPPASAMALADQLPNVTVHIADAGHIGMVIGSKARRVLYEPLSAFLLQCSIDD